MQDVWPVAVVQAAVNWKGIACGLCAGTRGEGSDRQVAPALALDVVVQQFAALAADDGTSRGELLYSKEPSPSVDDDRCVPVRLPDTSCVPVKVAAVQRNALLGLRDWQVTGTTARPGPEPRRKV